MRNKGAKEKWAGDASRVEPLPPDRAQSPLRLWGTIAALLALALALAYGSYRYQLSDARRIAYVQLSAMAEFKSRELAVWLAERRSDAAVIAAVPRFGENLTEVIAAGAPPTKGALFSILNSLRSVYAYQSAFALDPAGRLVFGVGPTPTAASVPLALVREAMQSRKIAYSNIRRIGLDDSAPWIIDIVVPLFAEPEGESSGAAVLRIDANDYLFPLLRRWPTPSQPAEMALVLREGGEILFLVDPHRSGQPNVAIRFPLTERSLPAVQAVLAPGKPLEGLDHAGIAIVAEGRAVEGTDWTLIAKMDLSEIEQHALRQAITMFAFLLLLLAGAGGLLGLRWAYQRRTYEQRLRLAALQREALAKHFEFSMKFASDIILLQDHRGQVVECNEAAESAYGYAREELLRLDMSALLVPGSRAPFHDELPKGTRCPGITFETEHRRKDGRTFSVEVSARAIDVEGKRYIQSISRDISERKANLLALEREAQRYKALMETTIEGIHIVDSNGRLVEANPAFLHMLGYEKDEAIGLPVTAWDTQFSPEELCYRLANRTAVGNFFGTRHRRKDGSVFDVEVGVSNFDIAGVRYSYCTARDITQRKEAERRIEHLTRLYATLSHTNRAIVRSKNEDELFAELCRVAVEQGGMLGAVVRMVEDEGKVLRAVACSESMRSLDGVIELRDEVPRTESPRLPVVAFHENRVHTWNDFSSASATDVQRRPASQLGIQAAAALPLRRDGKPVGVMMLNSAQPDFFDSDMRGLLEEMATDISYALGNFAYERRRKRGETALAESEEKFRGLVEQSIAGIYVVQDGRFTYVNPRLAEIGGYTPEEMIGQPLTMVVAEEDRAVVAENLRKRLSGEVKSIQYNVTGVRKDGTRITMGVHGTRATIDGKPAIVGLAQDISERERARREIESYLRQLEQTMLGTVQAVSTIVELRDPYTAGHERRVGALARAIGEELGLSEAVCRGLEITGAVHDIGKISVPAEILSKPGKLSEVEFGIIKTHPQLGYQVLNSVSFPWPVAQTILQHHERLDGSGYPSALKDGEIILEARILAVADVVESMGSHRPYRPTLGIEAALEEISAHRGVCYDENVVDACLRLFREKSYRLPD